MLHFCCDKNRDFIKNHKIKHKIFRKELKTYKILLKNKFNLFFFFSKVLLK